MPEYTNGRSCGPSQCSKFEDSGEDLQRGDLVLVCPGDEKKRYAPTEVITNEDGTLTVTEGDGNQTVVPNPVNIVITETNEQGETILTTQGGSGGGGTGGGPIQIPGLGDFPEVSFQVSQDAQFVTFNVDGNTVTVPTAAFMSGGSSASIVDNGDGTSTVTIGSTSFNILNDIGPKTPVFMCPNGAGQIEVTLADGTQFVFDATVSSGTGAPVLGGTFPQLTTGVPMTPFTLSNTGGPVDTWAITAGSLPAGLLFNSTTGQFTGTPTGNGSTVIDVTATNSSGSDTYTTTIFINIGLLAPDLSTSAAIPDATEGLAFGPYNATNTGGAVTTWSATGLPAGVTINAATGTITGTPTVNGTFNVAITATNATGSDTFNDTILIASDNLVFPGAETVTAVTVGGNEAVSQLFLLDNGEATKSLLNGSTNAPDWYDPLTPAIGSDYEVQYTLVSGDATVEFGGAFGTFYTVGEVLAGEIIQPRPVLRATAEDKTSVVTQVIREIANPSNSSTSTLTLNANSAAPLAGFDSAQITSIIDGGNNDDQTTGINNDANARLIIGDLTAVGVSTTVTVGATNGGVIDDVNTTGAPVVTGSHDGISFGDGIITIPSNTADIVDMRIVQNSGDALDEASFAGGAYTLGSYQPVGANQTIAIAYVVNAAGSGPVPGTIKTGNFTYEFRYSDGSSATQSMTLRATNNDGSIPP